MPAQLFADLAIRPAPASSNRSTSTNNSSSSSTGNSSSSSNNNSAGTSTTASTANTPNRTLSAASRHHASPSSISNGLASGLANSRNPTASASSGTSGGLSNGLRNGAASGTNTGAYGPPMYPNGASGAPLSHGRKISTGDALNGHGARPNATLAGLTNSPRPNAPVGIPIRRGSSSTGHYSHHKHARSSYSDSPLMPRNNSLTIRPAKRSMPTPGKTIAVINASGRQAASLIRYATAVGYHVRAQMRNRLGVIATEVATNENVTVIEGELYTRLPRSDSDKARGVSLAEDVDVTADGPSLSGIGVNYDLINELFRGAQLAFVNTTFYGDELAIGKAIADASKAAGVQHFVYSSMPDHSAYDPSWPSLPLWSDKHLVEEYVYAIGLPSTFVYTGIYNNNFTSLRYPLFCMDLQPDGSFVWEAPFHPDAKLPWLDAEHDVGPAILQIFKDGVSKWGKGQRIALAYEMLSPREACQAFAQGVGRPVAYRRGPIKINVPVPEGYRAQLVALEKLFMLGGDDPTKQPPYFGGRELDDDVPTAALGLWEGPRGLEEYAREVFPLEEHANGMTWMLEDDDAGEYDDAYAGEQVNGGAQPINIAPGSAGGRGHANADADADADAAGSYDDDDEALVMKVTARNDEEWLP